MSKHYKKPTLIIEPYYFAESALDTENYVTKRTCLWLMGLKLAPRKHYKVLENGVVNAGEINKKKSRTIYRQVPSKLQSRGKSAAAKPRLSV